MTREPDKPATELYAHYLAVVNWSVLLGTYLIGAYVFDAHLRMMILVALMGITIGNLYVYMSRANAAERATDVVTDDDREE